MLLSLKQYRTTLRRLRYVINNYNKISLIWVDFCFLNQMYILYIPKCGSKWLRKKTHQEAAHFSERLISDHYSIYSEPKACMENFNINAMMQYPKKIVQIG